MAYLPPVFNLSMSAWIAGRFPAAGAPDYTELPCQLYFQSRAAAVIQPGVPGLWVPPVYIRVPFDLVLFTQGAIFDPTGSGSNFFQVRWGTVVHQGFPNEYVAYLVDQCDGNGFDRPCPLLIDPPL